MAPPINSLLAYGSLLTAIKSGWELSRMLRRKLEDIRLSRLGANTRQSLSRALHSGCIDLFEYYKYQELIQFAENREDAKQLRKIWNKLARLRASMEN